MAEEIQSNIKINIDTANAMASLKALQNQISAFHTSMSKASAAEAAQVSNIQKNLINTINASGKFAASMTHIKTTTESFTTALEKNKLSLGEYFRYSVASSKSFGKVFQKEFDTVSKVARERVKDLQTQYIKLGRDANGSMQAIKIRPLVLDMENLSTKTQIAAQRQALLNQLLKQGSTNLLNFGKNTQWAGRQLMVGFTIPLAMMGAAAYKAYSQMEQAAVQFKRVYGDSTTPLKETNAMVKQVQGLANAYTQYGVAVADTMKMAADAAAMGKTGNDLLQQINNANKLSVLGGVDQQKSLQTTISLTNAFGIASKDLSANIDFLNAVENQTVLNIEDMTTAIPKAAPVVQQLGGNVKDLAFFLTAMKEGGINASEGANALKSGLAAMINPTSSATKMLSGFGINIKGIVEKDKGNLRKTVVDFASALDTLDPLNRAKAIEQMFGKFQFARISTLFKNVIDQGSQANKVMGLANKTSGELAYISQQEMKKISDSPLFKFQKVIADLQASLAPIGEQFLKLVTPILSFVDGIAKGFNNLPDNIKSGITAVTGLVLGLGPILLMTFGLIANGIANVIKGFSLVKNIFNKAGSGAVDLGSQVDYMTQQQIDAAAVAASLDQVHGKLSQTFTSEAGALNELTVAYERAAAAQGAMGGFSAAGRVAPRRFANGGMVTGPGGPKSDMIPANLSNGEAVIDAATVKKNPRIISALFSGRKIKLPGYASNNSTEFAHIGSSRQVGAQDLYNQILPDPSSVSTRGFRVVESLAKAFGNEFRVNLFGKLGITTGKTSSGQSINNLLDKSGVSSKEFLADWDKQGLQRWKKSLRYAGLKMQDVSEELSLLDSEMKKHIQSLGETTIQDKHVAEAFKVAAEKIGMTGSVVPSFTNLQNTAGELRTNISQAWADKGNFPSAPGGGSKGAVYLDNTKVRKGGDRFTFYTKAGIDLIENAKQKIIEGIKKATRQASPSKDAYDAGANIGKGAINGIRSAETQAVAAGENLATAIATGQRQSTRVKQNPNSDMDYNEATGQYSPKQAYGPENRTGLKRLTGNIAGRFRSGTERLSAGLQRATPGKVMGVGFGLSSAVGLASMMPGPVGDVAGQLSGPVMAISTLTSLFPGLISGFGALLPALLPFAPAIGIAALAIGGITIAANMAADAEKKRIKQLNALGDASRITADQTKTLGDFFKTVPNTFKPMTKFPDLVKDVTQQSSVASLMATKDFQKQFGDTMKTLSTATVGQIQNTLSALTVQFKGQGFSDTQIQTIVSAILQGSNNDAGSNGNAGLINPDKFVQATTLENANGVINAGISSLPQVYSAGKQVRAQKKRLSTGKAAASMGKDQIDKILNPETYYGPKTIGEITSLGGTVGGIALAAQHGTMQSSETDKFVKKIFGTYGKEQGGKTLISQAIAKSSIPNAAEIASQIKKLDPNKKAAKLILRGALAGYATLTDSQIKTIVDYESGKLQGKAKENAKALLDSYAQGLSGAGVAQDTKYVSNGGSLNGGGTDPLQKRIDNINTALTAMSGREDAINKKYDARVKALDAIQKANDNISQQQQNQLNLAGQLASGDVAAAAATAQGMRSQDTQNALDQQRSALDQAKQNELDNLTVKVGGKTYTKKQLDAMLTAAQNKQNNAALLKVGTLATGGIVPKYFAAGGFAMGTDTVPAMLTPGEFVVKKSAVDRIGTSTLNKINGYANGGVVGDSAGLGDSVYNYSINVSVATGANPSDIAHAVMKQIKNIDNQRVKGVRY